jgi:recombination protein RecR
VSRYAEPMARLIEELKKLPGVGAKSAQRFAFHILRSSDEDAAALAEAVRGLKASLRLCSVCNNVTDVDPCAYCASPARNQRLVCVVEEPTSIAAVERTRSSQGGYQGSITCCTAPFAAARRGAGPVAHRHAGGARGARRGG